MRALSRLRSKVPRACSLLAEVLWQNKQPPATAAADCLLSCVGWLLKTYRSMALKLKQTVRPRSQVSIQLADHCKLTENPSCKLRQTAHNKQSVAIDADQEAGALVPYLLGRTAKETWSFAIDASAYGKQDHLHDVAKRKGGCKHL